ncbi:MAG: FtsW/RodA/SpoVE family cell cycle protein [Negativibacillus massiliensis]|uniref:FtsW/RodA/SpoVE family cell cycle protein n=1 Tax=Negativibacillus massiliensis TaxID=1871035 RepID=UPI0009774E4C|nr:FtsW/RodA/SpoVE family cell cycle protein [Negativibacillus massiliensis]MCI6347038.1 FtsW/RodA/SpoVE family cell cycle protein [Negativibacillus massiliensis]MDY4047828.1 FtsW/RodA/SpoVE family cell cycle protein [Negativibacillus massiliensis]
MKTVFSAIGRYIKETDWMLMLCCFSLSSFSTLLIYSLYKNGEIGRLNTVLVQPAMALCGIVAAIILSKIDYHMMARLWKWHSVLCYGLALLVFPFGIQRVDWVDDKAWLPIPFTSISFQPSELLKISFIITFAYHLSKVKDQLNRPKQLLLLCIHGAIPCGLIHLQGDDGTVLVMAVIFASMLFVAGLSWKYIVPVLAMIPPAAVVLWNFFLDDDKKNRILAIIRPELVDSAITWQQDRGLISIGNGGLWGNGIFMETGQFRYVPEVYNDFIFTYIGETVGFIGCIAVLAALAFLCIRILHNALHALDDLGKFICVGVFAMMAIQIIINIGMCLGVLPVIGVTLPFLSAGGTSTGTLYLGIGVVLSVYMHSGKDMLFA